MNDKLCSFADFKHTDEVVRNIVLRFVEEASDDFWKVLKYGNRDATTNTSYTITTDDKYNMVAQYLPTTRIKRYSFNDDITEETRTELRIYEAKWQGITSGVYDIELGFEILSHNDIIALNDGRLTINIIRSEIYRLLAGRSIESNFGRMDANNQTGWTTRFNKQYQGYTLTIGMSS